MYEKNYLLCLIYCTIVFSACLIHVSHHVKNFFLVILQNHARTGRDIVSTVNNRTAKYTEKFFSNTYLSHQDCLIFIIYKISFSTECNTVIFLKKLQHKINQHVKFQNIYLCVYQLFTQKLVFRSNEGGAVKCQPQSI